MPSESSILQKAVEHKEVPEVEQLMGQQHKQVQLE